MYATTSSTDKLNELEATHVITVLGISGHRILYHAVPRRVVEGVKLLKEAVTTVPHDASGSRTPGNISVDADWLTRIIHLIEGI